MRPYKAFGIALAAFTISYLALVPTHSEAQSLNHNLLIAAKTEPFKEKEGFERNKKDIINTLKDNDVAQFTTLLDGLQQAYELDKTLKGNGPYTFFAPNDKAFKKMPDDDKQTLWANKKKLKQVLQYHIVFGDLDGKALRTKHTVKTLEGHSITMSTKGNDLYADKSLITVTDIPCSNGVIHILDEVIMPPLSK